MEWIKHYDVFCQACTHYTTASMQVLGSEIHREVPSFYLAHFLGWYHVNFHKDEVVRGSLKHQYQVYPTKK